MGPVRDFQCTATVLHLNSIADVDKIPVFEDQGVVPACQLLQPANRLFVKADNMLICVLKTAVYGPSAGNVSLENIFHVSTLAVSTREELPVAIFPMSETVESGNLGLHSGMLVWSLESTAVAVKRLPPATRACMQRPDQRGNHIYIKLKLGTSTPAAASLITMTLLNSSLESWLAAHERLTTTYCSLLKLLLSSMVVPNANVTTCLSP